MPQNKIVRFGPVALTTTLTTNILNVGAGALATPPVGYTFTQDYIILRHIRISNKTASAATFSLWIGATGANAAGTEFIGTAFSVAANAAFDWNGLLRLVSADFFFGGAGPPT